MFCKTILVVHLGNAMKTLDDMGGLAHNQVFHITKKNTNLAGTLSYIQEHGQKIKNAKVKVKE
jgi:hypothetical protein